MITCSVIYQCTPVQDIFTKESTMTARGIYIYVIILYACMYTVWREISEGFNIRGFRGSIPICDLFWIIRGVVSTHGPDQLL